MPASYPLFIGSLLQATPSPCQCLGVLCCFWHREQCGCHPGFRHLSSVCRCQRLILLESGGIADHGSFKDLYDRNERFRRMVDLAQLDF